MRLHKVFAILAPLTLGGVGGGLLSSCSDWDDHFDADTSVTGSQRSSLLANIQQNAELSQFADLLEKTGYSSMLDQAQTYTVWAPKNNTFDYDALMAESDDDVKRQFVENHIARNNYPASGQVSERIYMLNKKVMNFASTADGYAMQDVQLQLPSIGGNNGTIHLLDGKIPYLSNIYESLNNKEFQIDSIAEYFHSYDTLMLDENKSVKGPAVDGEITYLDAVYTERNDLYSIYRAYINREDSSYSMLVPTNTAWEKAKQRISPFFDYAKELRIRNFISNGTAWEKKDTLIKVADPARLQDSIANTWILKNLFFNNRLYDNGKLLSLQDGGTLTADSLVTTQGWIYSAAASQQMFAGAKRVDKSNGAIFVVDELTQPSWLGLCPPIKVEAENDARLVCYENTEQNKKPTRERVTSANQNPAVAGSISDGYYLNIPPYSDNTDQKVTLTLPHMRSTTYHAFAVIVPSHITNTYLTDLKPNRLRIYFGYSNINATSKMLEIKEQAMRSVTDKAYFETDPTKIDTLDLGEVTFPMCYEGLGNYYPFIRVETNSRKTHDHTLRLDCIMLVPKDLYDFMGGVLDDKILNRLW